PKKIDDTIIIPLVDVTFGMGTGAGTNDKKASGGGGIGGKMTPSAILIITNGVTKLINIKNQDAVTKILDMVPDVINKLTEKKDGSPELSDREVMDLAFDKADEKE
ncbi:MAG: GerW family sporulation protein, partial [Lachnospiraceae bacterium]|nr:GerW family sporulation protein [Lachnospiraceae bacterium]